MTARTPSDSPVKAQGRPLRALRRWFGGGLSFTSSTRDALLDALFERAGDGLMVCTAEGVVLTCNSLAAQLLQLEPSEMIGHHVSEYIEQGKSERRFSLRDGPATTRVEKGDAPPRPIHLTLTPFESSKGAQVVLRVRDVAERADAQERLRQLANFDSLTGLPNRALFRDRLGQAMARAQRSSQAMALMFLDLDRFKVVNDDLGHEVGDRLLRHVSQALTKCLRAADSVGRDGEPAHTLSRLGGDEFTVIVENVGSPDDAAHIARRMLEALNEPFLVDEEEIVISASIGISMYPTDDVDLDTLIRHTDMAMYRSKSLGRGTYSFFSDDLTEAVTARVSLEGSLRRAIERQEFVLHFQPKSDLRTGQVTGVEALVRWHRPGHGMVPPDRFVGVLEDTGLILPVGAWVIRAACEQLAAWDRAGLPPIRLAVNLSARQFRHLYLASLVEDSLRQNEIDPQRLEIELTESLLMEDNESTRSMLDSFRRLGVRLAIDDFGTGHSSLSYIKRFSIDTLKIDRSFVHSLPDNEEDAAICAAVIALGRSMRMCVVAEGVETPEQARLLRDLGCDEMQGYWLGRPMPGSEFVAWFVNHKRARSRRRSHSRYTDTSPMTLFNLLDGS
ncbi:MAG TPA: EAL domain-containing protein [Burkholderiaceae bacterium]|nr:EAL domain-containing protein [Burkholderiaceae bacterium]